MFHALQYDVDMWQIQLILYETHSSLEAENQAQVTRAISEANRLARERYALLKKKHRQAANVSFILNSLNDFTLYTSFWDFR